MERLDLISKLIACHYWVNQLMWKRIIYDPYQMLRRRGEDALYQHELETIRPIHDEAIGNVFRARHVLDLAQE